MPGRKAHRRATKLLLGDGHDEVHRALDWPHRFLGPRHRVLFHDPVGASGLGFFAALAAGKNPITGALAGLVHVTQDWSRSGIGRILKPLRLGGAGGLGGLLALCGLLAVLVLLYFAVIIGALVFVVWAACEVVAQVGKYRNNRAQPEPELDDAGANRHPKAEPRDHEAAHGTSPPATEGRPGASYSPAHTGELGLISEALQDGFPESHYISERTRTPDTRPRAKPQIVSRWYLERHDGTWGPYTRSELLRYLSEGRAAPDDLVRSATGGGLKRLGAIVPPQNGSPEDVR